MSVSKRMATFIFFATVFAISISSQVSSLPILIPALSVSAISSVIGADRGAIKGQLVSLAPDANGKERSQEDKLKIYKAGLLKGTIEGSLFIPSIFLGPLTKMLSNKVAADTLGIKDQRKVMKASLAAGMPIANAFPDYKASVTASTLEVPNPFRSMVYSKSSSAGELDALVQFKDKETKDAKE